MRRGRRLRVHAPLRRATPLKRRRSRPRRGPARSPAYLAWVRTLKCAAPQGLHGCRGKVEAHHAGARGLGQRAGDDTAIPLCTFHHRAWHDGRGVFVDWDKATRAAWVAAVVSEVQQRWLDRTPPLGSA